LRTSILRVLVADDQPLTRWAVAEALVSRGHHVHTAATRAEACARLFHERFDAVVMACQIDGQDMTDVLRELARYEPAPRLVVLCHGEGADPQPHAASGAAVLAKPFELSALVAAVDPERIDEHPEAGADVA